ncbi:hypothetical protein V6N11_083787 [Hibiscus sabdariffa]|uniref:Pectinesterase inhibitor domain-containing protein n=1 Tax=Hibiscus sabdariffa TaxID=183260 RepID=A0ABR2QCK4_9ROSI
MTNDIFWHIANVDTWVVAALTDVNRCINEFSGHRMSKMKATIKSKVLNVAQLTSNALLPWGEEDKSFKLQFQALRVRFKGNEIEGISSRESKEGPLSLD